MYVYIGSWRSRSAQFDFLFLNDLVTYFNPNSTQVGVQYLYTSYTIWLQVHFMNRLLITELDHLFMLLVSVCCIPNSLLLILYSFFVAIINLGYSISSSILLGIVPGIKVPMFMLVFVRFSEKRLIQRDKESIQFFFYNEGTMWSCLFTQYVHF